MAAKKTVGKRLKKGPLLTATLPSKLLRLVMEQATANGQTFSDFVIDLFESAVDGGVQEVKG